MELQNESIYSKMEVEINSILSTKQYRDLKPAFPCPDEFKFRSRGHKSVMKFCDLLNILANDTKLWKKHEIPECIFHVLRLRCMIIDNVLKAIFIIHERNKKNFMNYFEKQYVKTFTFPISDKKVKIVVLKDIKNGHLDLDRLRPQLQNLSITPSRPRVYIPSATEDAFDALRNMASRISHRVQPPPMTTADIPSSHPKPVDINAIETLPDESETGGVGDSRRTIQTASTSRRTDDEVLDEEALRVRQFLIECGIGIEGLEHIKTIDDMNKFLDTNITSLRTTTPQIIDVPPMQFPSIGSQSSDVQEENLVVHAEVHPVPGEDVSLLQIAHILESRQAALFKKAESITNQARVQLEAHLMSQRRTLSAEPTPITIAAKRISSQIQPVQISPVPMPVTEENAFVSAAPEKSNLPVPQVEIDRENANAMSVADNLDGVMQFIQEIQEILPPTLPVTPPVPKPITEKPVVEGIEPTTEAQDQGAAVVTTRSSIANFMLQSGQRGIPNEFLRALDQPGPHIEVPQLDVPIIDINEKTRPSSPLLRIRDILEDTPPVRRTPVERKKYSFYSKLVVSRKLKKIIKPQNYVSNAERAQDETEIKRNPGDRIFPFHEYQDDQPAGDELRYIPRFKDVFEGELPKCENMMANLLCQLFETCGEDDVMYDEENECEMRIENLRASIRYLQDPALQQSRPSYRFEEPPRQISHSIRHQKESLLQVPLSEIPLLPVEIQQSRISSRSPAVPGQSLTSVDNNRASCIAPQIPAIHVSNVADVSLQVPMAERPSLAQKSPVLAAAVQLHEVEIQPKGSTERDKLAHWEDIIPQKRLQRTVDENVVDAVQTINLPHTMDTSQQIPLVEGQIVAQEAPAFIPLIQVAEVEVRTTENIERDRAVDWEEVIPQKRLRRMPARNVVDVSQIPIGSDRPAGDLLMDQNATYSSQAFAELQQLQREQIIIDQGIVGVPQMPIETELRPIDQISYVPQNVTATASASIEDPIEIIPPQRPRVTYEMVLDKLKAVRMEKPDEIISFTDLCPFTETNRFTAACSFSILIDLQTMGMLKLHQEPEESSSPESLKISPL